jgi:hypothetical protein
MQQPQLTTYADIGEVEHLGPAPPQALGFGRGHQHIGLEQATLGISLSEHGPLPGQRAASRPIWPHYALLGPDRPGVFTIESRLTGT